MQQKMLEITENTRLARDVYRMVLKTDEPLDIRPGQFLNIRLSGRFLRRPISICDWDGQSVTIIYKVVGEGTADMEKMAAGEPLDVLVPLGNGFDTAGTGKRPLLAGGGAGVPPIYGLAKELVGAGAEPVVILGYNGAEDVFLAEAFEALGAEVRIATMDGSAGTKGLVTDLIGEPSYTAAYACGPVPMLKALDEALPEDMPGWFSLEERMGCGFGICMGCSKETKDGHVRLCKEGPVLERRNIIW